MLQYGYVWDVRRIFGDEGPAGRRDLESDSHLIHLACRGWDPLSVALFAYLLDFDNSAGNSSDSCGVRLTGSRKLTDDVKLSYTGSYAFQSDGGDNPVDYDATYVHVEGGLAYEPLGTLGVGYEILGSDDGTARFVTPLATGHKFNGFADAFLNNGGAPGLRDAYVFFSPKLPLKLKGKVTYHRFRSDDSGSGLGQELDFVLKRPINGHITVLSKGAWFDGQSGGPADRWRLWLEVTFKY